MSQPMPKKYNALRLICTLQMLVGAATIAIGILLALAAFFFDPGAGNAFAGQQETIYARLALGFASGIFFFGGLMQIAAAEVIYVFLDQEEHQRDIRQMLTTLMSRGSSAAA